MKLAIPFAVFAAMNCVAATARDVHRVPIAFEENRGQFAPGVLFGTHGAGPRLTVFRDGLHIEMGNTKNGERRAFESFNIGWTNAGSRLDIAGDERLPGTASYLFGVNRSAWLTGVRLYRKVRIKEVFQGIDIVLYGNGDHLEYDLILKPHADVRKISLRFSGMGRLSRSSTGDLVADYGPFKVLQPRPKVYQEVSGRRVEISGDYVIHNRNEIGFRLSSYNRNTALVIDPALTFSTLFGGTGDDSVHGVALDASGNVYIVGETSSTDFPLWNPVEPYPAGPNSPGSKHIFVTELDATGGTILFSTYLGGSVGESGRKIAVDSSGNVYVAGSTVSQDFPVTNGTLRPASAANGRNDITLTKLAPGGASIVYSAVIGGTGDDELSGLAVDAAGNCFLAGTTNSIDFPATPGARNDLWKLDGIYSTAKVFVSKVNPLATNFVYSAILGGTGVDQGTALAIDASGTSYVAGTTTSTDFPITPGAYQTSSHLTAPNTKAFVTKVSPDGAIVNFSTYLGGSGSEQIAGIAVGGAGKIYVTGLTSSPDFPVTAGAYIHPANGSANAVFVTKFALDGASLVYSALFGGVHNSLGDIAVDGSGQAAITGTVDNNFPVTQGSPQVYPGDLAAPTTSATNGFLIKLNNYGTTPIFSTYMGGTNARSASVSVDRTGAAVVAGTGDSTFPVTIGSYRSASPGRIFVAKISDTSTCTYTVQALSALSASVATQTGCRWVSVSGASWLSVTAGASGLGSGTVQLAAQNSGVSRSGIVSIAGSQFVVNQAGVGCQLVLSSPGRTFAADGGIDQFSGFTSPGCLLPTAVSTALWIHLTSQSGASPYSYSVDRNTSGQSRSGSIQVGSQIFAISQNVDTCTFAVSPSTIITFAGNAVALSLTANYPTCGWTATSNSQFLAFTPAQGRGSSSVVIDTSLIAPGTPHVLPATIASQSLTVYVVEQGLQFSITNKLTGKALDVMNASNQNCAAIVQFPYQGRNDQQWQLIPVGGGYYKIQNKLSGKVLDVTSVSTVNGAPIQQYDWVNGDNQKWSLSPVDNGYYKIVNKHSGKVLDVTNLSTVDGAPIQQYDYLGGDNQKWQLTPIPYFEIANKNSGKALDVRNYSLVNGGGIQQWDYLGGLNQQWQLVRVDSASFEIINSLSGKVLDVTGVSTASGAPIQQWDYLGGDNQRWMLVQVDAQNYRIINKNSGKVLDVTIASKTNGASIQQSDYLGTDSQRWQLIPALSN